MSHLCVSDYTCDKIEGDTMIRECSCKHKFQDKEHGVGMRVHNPAESKTNKDKKDWVCTVCNTRKVK